MSWQLVEAGDLMARRNGSVNPANFSNEKFELHSIPAFDRGRPEVLSGSEIGSTKQVVQPNDVMISKIVPHIRRSTVVGKSSGLRQIASGEWIVFRSERFFPHYLRHLLISNQFNAQFMATVSGVGGSLLRARPAEVAKIKIPLPPVNEQRRIAAILDKADALRGQHRAAIAKLDELLQSVFIEMFGDPVTNTKKWKTLPLSKITSQINDCPHSTPVWTDGGKICLRTSNLRVGYWDWTETRYVSEATYSERSSRGYIEPGDIVLSREGTVGIAAIVTPNMKVCMGQRLVQVRVNDSFMTPDYLLRYLLTALSPEKISRLMVGSTAKHLNVKELRALAVPLPHLDLQQRFAQIAEKIESQKQIMQRAAEKAETLFASLQQRAFSGKL